FGYARALRRQGVLSAVPVPRPFCFACVYLGCAFWPQSPVLEGERPNVAWWAAKSIEGRVGMIQTIERGADSDKSSDTRSLISLRGISRVHDGGAIAALRNVDLQIAAGECVAIVGAGGGGKSSLGNMLCGIDFPTPRTLLWDGPPLSTPPRST